MILYSLTTDAVKRSLLVCREAISSAATTGIAYNIMRFSALKEIFHHFIIVLTLVMSASKINGYEI